VSIEQMMHQQLLAIGKLTHGVERLADATTQLVDLTRALHRERSVQLMQEFEKAKGEDEVRYRNFDMFFIQKRLEMLQLDIGVEIPKLDQDDMPSLVVPPATNGAAKRVPGKR
jgi:hypothetical protein